MARPADPNARSALVAAARAQFRQHGILHARIEDITAACGLSKGSFYLHFESKEALFHELVAEFERQMDSLFAMRTSEEEAFFRRGGSFTSRNRRPGSRRLSALDALQTRHDLATLELMWSMRDVIHVLMNGSQGTAFDGIIWMSIDREQQRVVEACDRLKQFGVIRGDLSSELIAMMLMGAWVMQMRKMVIEPEKPDLAAIIASLNRLLTEGVGPRPPAPRTVSPAPAVRGARLVSLPRRRGAATVSLRKAP